MRRATFELGLDRAGKSHHDNYSYNSFIQSGIIKRLI